MGNGRIFFWDISQLKLGGRQQGTQRAGGNKQITITNKNKYLGRKKDFPTLNKILIQGPAKKPLPTGVWTAHPLHKGADQAGEWSLQSSLHSPYQAVCHGAVLCLVSKRCIFFLVYTKAAYRLPLATEKSLPQSWGIVSACQIIPLFCGLNRDHSLLYHQKAVLHRHDGFTLLRFFISLKVFISFLFLLLGSPFC